MSTINRLRGIADDVRPRRTSRRLAPVSVSGRGFTPIEDDFFAREAELYEPRGPDEDELESSNAPARRSRMLVASAVVAAAAVSFVSLRPNVLSVQALMTRWHVGTENKVPASTSEPAPSRSTVTAISSAAIVRPAPELPKQEVAQPQREAPQEAAPAPAAPAASPRRVSKSSARFASALSKCRTESSADHVHRALDACRKAVALQHHSPEALTLLARAEIDRHHAREAQRLATVALSSDPSFTDAYVVMGKAHQQAGQKSQARASYRQYLAIAPHGRYAGEVRRLLSRGL